MTLYPTNLEGRFNAGIKRMRERLDKLESRTAMLDSGFPLAILPGSVDAAYTSGDPKVALNGSGVLTGPYWHLASYTPVAGDLVAVAPIPAMGTYVVLGKLT